MHNVKCAYKLAKEIVFFLAIYPQSLASHVTVANKDQQWNDPNKDTTKLPFDIQ